MNFLSFYFFWSILLGPKGPFLKTPKKGVLRGIISTPKIDFRADFDPTPAAKTTCFDLLKIRRPLRQATKTGQKKGLV